MASITANDILKATTTAMFQPTIPSCLITPVNGLGFTIPFWAAILLLIAVISAIHHIYMIMYGCACSSSSNLISTSKDKDKDKDKKKERMNNVTKQYMERLKGAGYYEHFERTNPNVWNYMCVDPNNMDASQYAGLGPACTKLNETCCLLNPLYPVKINGMYPLTS